MSALDKNVESRTRKEHLQVISMMKKSGDFDGAQMYWLRNCPRISRKAEKAV